MANSLSFGSCPLCSLPLSLESQHRGALLECPMCGGRFTLGDTYVSDHNLHTETIPAPLGDSFISDGFTIENGILVSYEGSEQIINIPSGTVAIGECVFKGNQSIKEVHIPEGVLYICQHAFEGCEHLKALSLPSSLLAMGSCAFAYCRRLKSVQIPKGLLACGHSIFRGCDNLEYADFPMDMKYIVDSPYRFCKRLKSATIPNCVSDLTFWFSEVNSLERLYIGKRVNHLSCAWLGTIKELYFENTQGWHAPINSGSRDNPVDPSVLADPEKASSLAYKLGKNDAYFVIPTPPFSKPPYFHKPIII